MAENIEVPQNENQEAVATVVEVDPKYIKGHKSGSEFVKLFDVADTEQKDFVEELVKQATNGGNTQQFVQDVAGSRIKAREIAAETQVPDIDTSDIDAAIKEYQDHIEEIKKSLGEELQKKLTRLAPVQVAVKNMLDRINAEVKYPQYSVKEMHSTTKVAGATKATTLPAGRSGVGVTISNGAETLTFTSLNAARSEVYARANNGQFPPSGQNAAGCISYITKHGWTIQN